MSPRDFILMMSVCLAWALNVAISKVVLTDLAVPPLFYAGLRFLLVGLFLAPLLRPLPPHPGRVMLAALTMGGGHFGLLFIGLQSASPSATAILLQMGVPFSALLGVLMLGERMTPLRVLGIAMAVAGTMMTVFRSGLQSSTSGIVLVTLAAGMLSLGSILFKRLQGVGPLQFQAWTGLVSGAPLLVLSGLGEAEQIPHAIAGGWIFAAALAISVFGVTILAQTRYATLLQRYDMGVVAPLTLAMPLMTVTLGVAFLGDPMSLRIAAGMGLALAGVFVVQRSALRR